MEHGFDACVFTPVDTPSLTSTDLQTLIDAFANHRDQVVCAVSQQTPDHPEPLIAIYPVTLFDVIDRSIDEEQYSPRRLLRSLSIITIPLSAESCRNINTPSDLDSHSPQP
ncbi:molybdopterin-guanine dinucleotide biosynthesis protein MobA [Stieleria neptunia]|uniref:Molybdopterin-guanine dinucleotide biosynthesis protein MobA n=2 Tax=Stieleria neptunia TaxID=2527979 RepID=A0A518HH81_9BACT|nr:molybdopterin-guanine dinucleotide biosynthesis protein MobA [Stieleria neptunia]